jgi:hypothetical protein
MNSDNIRAKKVCVWVRVIPTLGIHMHSRWSDVGVDVNSIARYRALDIPPWLLRAVQFDLSLHEIGCKSDVSPDVFQSCFNEIILVSGGNSRIYSDGSKQDAAAGAAAVTESAALLKRLP